MEEKILEILQRNIYYSKEDVLVVEPLIDIAKEIASLQLSKENIGDAILDVLGQHRVDCDNYQIVKDKLSEFESELSALKSQLKEQEVSDETSFVRSGNYPNEIIWQGVKYVKKEFDITCDTCGCHPSIIINTVRGRFCQEHAKY